MEKKTHLLEKAIPILLIVFLTSCSTPSYLRENRLLLARGECQLAIQNYQASIKAEPYQAIPYFGLAEAFYLENRYLEAKEAIDKAILLEPQIDDFRLLAGKIYFSLEDYFTSISHLSSSLSLNSSSLESYVYLALAYEKTGETGKALKRLEIALSIEPLYFDAHLHWIRIRYLELLKKQRSMKKTTVSTTEIDELPGEYSFLISKLTRALKINPTSVPGNLLLSKVYYSYGARRLSRTVLLKWLERNGTNDEMSLALAQLDFRRGDYVATLSRLRKLKEPTLNSKILTLRAKHEINPRQSINGEVNRLLTHHASSDKLLFLAAKIAWEAGREKVAETRALECLNINPDYARAHYLLSQIRQSRNDFYGARLALRKAFELSPIDDDIMYKYIKQLIDLGEWNSADMALKSNRSFANTPNGVFLQALLLKKTGKLKEARQLLNNTQTDRYSIEAETLLADLEIRMGKLVLAEKRLKRLSTLAPNTVDIALVQAALLFKQKNNEGVIALLKPFLTDTSGRGRAHLMVAESMIIIGHLSEAVAVLKQGLRLWPRHLELTQRYTMYLGLEGKYSEAIALMEDIQSFKHKYNQLFFYRLRTYYFNAGKKKKFRQYLYQHRN